MSEEDIIKILQHYLEMEEFDNAEDFLVAIDKILDLYQKEKEKNKEYEILLKRQEELEQEKENLIKQGWLNEC